MRQSTCPLDTEDNEILQTESEGDFGLKLQKCNVDGFQISNYEDRQKLEEGERSDIGALSSRRSFSEILNEGESTAGGVKIADI